LRIGGGSGNTGDSLCELRTDLWFQRYRSTGQFRSIEKRIGY
jgi:hypothetical protein